MLRFYLSFLIFLTIFIGRSNAQTYIMNPSQPTLTSCSGLLTDSGGPNGNYGGGQNLSTTVCSPNATGETHINLFLNNASIELNPGDILCFYDGTNTDAPLLGCLEDFSFLDDFNVQATAANASGCVTVQFISQTGSSASGFQAGISCTNPCQPIIVSLDTVASFPAPNDSNYLDVCPGSMISVTASVAFPQNGQVYNQSPFTSEYVWNFGDGTIKYGLTATHTYTISGGFTLDLTVTDSIGCKNANRLGQKVRVATRPQFNLQDVDPFICLGDTLTLTASSSDSTGNPNLTFTPVQGGFPTGAIMYDSLALPDGSGVSYTSTITFTDFLPGQVITTANDLESICLNMEHSYMGDLSMSITCPSNQQVMLKLFGAGPGGGGGGTILGEPVATNLPVDGSGGSLAGIPGIGYEYCFSMNSISGYITNPANWTNVSPYTDPIGNVSTNPTINQANTGTYLPSGNFADLVGCPLNGPWTLSVTDHLFLDDGFIFYWTINFLSSLYPSSELFTPEVISYTWLNNSTVLSNTGDTLVAVPTAPGSASYTFEVNDNFGCTFDTTIVFQVLSPTDPECLNCGDQLSEIPDTAFCLDVSGISSDTFSIDIEIEDLSITMPFTSAFNTPIAGTPTPVATPLKIPIGVSGVMPFSFSADNFISVCLDIQHFFPTDLHLSLEAPNGTVILLKNTGTLSGAAQNISNACFTLDATTVFPNNNALAPFTGNWLPQQANGWNNMIGVPVNGTWYLRIATPNFTFPGNVNWWSITFDAEVSYTYSWSPNTGISCTNCPNPSFFPAETTTYTVELLNNYGCIEEQSFTISIGEYFSAPVLQCGQPSPTGVSVNWDPVAGNPTSYQVSVDNGLTWTITTDTFFMVDNLLPGQEVTFIVAAVSECVVPADTLICTAIECDLQIIAIVSTDPLCAENQDGSAFGAADFGIEPYIFNWSGPVNVTGDSVSNLPEGVYILTVTDFTGCIAVDSVILTAPNPLSATFNTSPASCAGVSDGYIEQSAINNATGNVSFLWSNGAEGPLADSLAAGWYSVTVTDELFCVFQDSIFLTQPESIEIDSIVTEAALCSGSAEGMANVFVSGGTLPYTYLWNDSLQQTTQQAFGLSAGMYEVEITDAAGCIIIAENIEVLEPDPIEISVTFEDVLCTGDNTGAASVAVTGGTGTYSFLWNIGSGTATDSMASDLTAGQYDVIVSDANNCQAQVDFEINEPAEALSASATESDVSCYAGMDGSIDLDVDGGTGTYLFVWSNGSTQQNIFGVGVGTYTATVTDANGCTLIIEAEIDQPDEISLNTTAQNPECYGFDDGQASVTATGGTPPFSYTWDDPSGQTASIAGNLSAGIYSVVVSDANNCTTTANVEITDPEPLDISFSTTDALCYDSQDGNATVSASGGSGVFTYQWSNGDSGSSIQVGAGIYFVTISDQNGCSQTAQATINQPDQITATAISNPALCFGDATGIASVTAAGGAGNFSFQWNDALSQTGNSAENLAAGVYTVTVTDGQDCSIEIQVPVSEPSFAISGIIEANPVKCHNSQDGFAEIVPHGGTMPYTYNWSNSTSSSNQAGNLSPGVFNIVITDANGCSYQVSGEIEQPNALTLSIDNTQPALCNGASNGIAVATASGGTPGSSPNPEFEFVWSTTPPQTGSQATQLKGGESYSVLVTDGNGCTTSAGITIAQPDPIQASISTIPAMCFGENSGEATVTNINGGTAPYQFAWNQAAGNQTSQIASDLFAGQYKVTITDGNGCTKTLTTSISQPDQMISEFLMTPVSCKGDSTGSISLSTEGGYEPYTYFWADSTFSNLRNQLPPGIYPVTVSDAFGCEETLLIEVTEPESALSLTFESEDIKCSGGNSGIVRLSGQGGTPSYKYSLNNSDFTTGKAFGNLSAGFQIATVQDAMGCIYTDTIYLQDGESFYLTGQIEYDILFKHSVDLSVNVEGVFSPPLVYHWSSLGPGNLSCTNCPSPSVTPDHHTYYYVTVTDANGCTAEFTLKVLVEKIRNVFVPNAFTPNDDDINDVFMVHGPYDMVIESFTVFDRWGNQVFLVLDATPNQEQFGWDGRFRGAEVQSGVFSWHLQVIFSDGHRESFTGHTTLQR